MDFHNYNPLSLPLVSICILSFNRLHKLAINLKKIQEDLNYPAECLEIFVVDNASSDGSADMVREKFPHVKLIELPENTGITGWNSAFREAAGKYVVVLDDDAFLEGDSLLKAVLRAEADAQIGILAVRVVSPTTGMEFTKEYPTGNLSYWGCSAILRKAMLDQIGFYDPQFFFQVFELDITIRARAAGWKVEYHHDIIAYHMTTINTSQTPQKFYFSRRNLFIVATKAFRWPSRIIVWLRLMAITFAFGHNQGRKIQLRAIWDGLKMGLRSKPNPLPPELERIYRGSFCEFVAPRLQKTIWHDPAKTFWRQRPEQYPDIFRDEGPASGSLLYEDAMPNLLHYANETWAAIIGEKNWFGIHPAPSPETPPARLIFKNVKAGGMKLCGRASLPDDRAAPVKGIVEFVRNDECIGRMEINDLHGHRYFDILIPSSFDICDVHFLTEMEDSTDPFYYGTVYWLNPKLISPATDTRENGNASVATQYQSLTTLSTIFAEHVEITEHKEEENIAVFDFQSPISEEFISEEDSFIKRLYTAEEIYPLSNRQGTVHINCTTAKVNKYYYYGEDWRAIITRPHWAMTHPTVGEPPAVLTFENIPLDGHHFTAGLFVPECPNEVVFVLRIMEGTRTIREHQWPVRRNILAKVNADLSDLKGIYDIALFTRMPKDVEDAAFGSAYWIRPQFEIASLNADLKLPTLGILVHSLNVDGANGIILDALKRPSFRHQFDSIHIISPTQGRLIPVLTKLGARISILSSQMTSDAVSTLLEQKLADCDHVWVNTVDHLPQVWQAIVKLNCKGLIFGHEAMNEDSLVLPTTRWNHGSLMLLNDIRSLGRMQLCWPSTSTVNQARKFLQNPNVSILPYGVQPVGSRPNVYVEEDMSVLRFMVGGWYCRRKNQDALLAIFKDIEKIINAPSNAGRYRDYHLTFAGTFFANYEYLDFMKKAAEIIPASKLTFMPIVDNSEMRRHLGQSHFLAVNALSEALPVTIMEIMSDGGLVISTDVEGSEDLIAPDCGYVYPRQDFAKAVEIYLSLLDRQATTPADLRKMSKIAKKKMAQFSMDIYEDNLLQKLGVSSKQRVSIFALSYPSLSARQYKGMDWIGGNVSVARKILTHPPHPTDKTPPISASFTDVYWENGSVLKFKIDASQSGRTESIVAKATVIANEGKVLGQQTLELTPQDRQMRGEIIIADTSPLQTVTITFTAQMAPDAKDNACASVIWSDIERHTSI